MPDLQSRKHGPAMWIPMARPARRRSRTRLAPWTPPSGSMGSGDAPSARTPAGNYPSHPPALTVASPYALPTLRQKVWMKPSPLSGRSSEPSSQTRYQWRDIALRAPSLDFWVEFHIRDFDGRWLV